MRPHQSQQDPVYSTDVGGRVLAFYQDHVCFGQERLALEDHPRATGHPHRHVRQRCLGIGQPQGENSIYRRELTRFQDWRPQ
jgi:hypothetical protein